MAVKTKKIHKNRIVGIALLAFTVYIVISLVWIHNDMKEKKSELTALQGQIDEQTVVNQEIQDMLDKGIDQSYIIKIARDKLDFVFPNERVYQDVAGK